MSIRLKVTHRTGFSYAGGALTSYNEARMTPQTTLEQELRHSRLDVLPTPWSFSYTDYWGTAVTAFEVHEKHEKLSVTCTSTVDVDREVRSGAGLTWADLQTSKMIDEFVETLHISPRVEPGEDLLTRVRPLAQDSAKPGDYARAVVALIHDEVEYVTGSTHVESQASEAWAARSGVCQDMAHLAVGCLRDAGIPARYVSGYLVPRATAEIGHPVSGESHAWVEWWDGEWVGYDPTNGIGVNNHHVVVAHGRDYADVTPLRGIFTGGSTLDMFVEVEITRLR
jgi:transglutaminase-like putative cysteine protease